MAQIVFIINDEDGAVNVTAAAEPYIPIDSEAEITPAQAVAQVIAAAIANLLSPPEEDSSEAGKQLVIVGDPGDGDSAGA